MNTIERLLALDAALVGSEQCVGIHPAIRRDIAALQHSIETFGKLDEEYPAFDDFLNAQLRAVRNLAASPQVFGHDGN